MAAKKKLPEAERPRVRDFQPISSRHGQNFDPVEVIFSGFRRQTPLNLETGENQGHKWIQHPQNRGIPGFQPWGPTFVDLKASGAGPATCASARRSRLGILYAGMRAHPPQDPPGRPLGRQKWVPRAGNMVSPYFEGAKSISGLGFPQFQGVRGVRRRKPENMTSNGSKFCP